MEGFKKRPGMFYVAAGLISIALYAGAYLAMMQPYLFWCRPYHGFGTATFAKPAYRWRQDAPLAPHQAAWQSFFSPAFAIHCFIDPNWHWFKFKSGAGRVPMQNYVKFEDAFAEANSQMAWPADGYGRITLDNWNQKK